MLAISSLSKNKHRLKSLTLIEVMVAVGISVLLIAVSIPLFNRDGNKQSLEKEAEAVSAFYSKAQNYAFHPERKDVEYYSVSTSDCSSGKCHQLIIEAHVDGSTDQIDLMTLPRAVVTEVPEVDFELQSGRVIGTSPINSRIFFESNPNQYVNLTIYSTGLADVEI